MEQLTKEEINRRMQELRNLKVLHEKSVEMNMKIKEQNKLLVEQVGVLTKLVKNLEKENESLKVLVKEFQGIIFGKKNKKDEDDKGNDMFGGIRGRGEKKPRSKESYKRETPNNKDITETKEYTINECPDCQSAFKKKNVVIFYEEDIKLPSEKEKLKIVREHKVEKGYCGKCKKWYTALTLPRNKVIIGEKVKIYIAYLSLLMRLSFEQIQNILRDTFSFKVSDGEIGNILEEMSLKWKPEFERIKKRLEGGKGVHLDETSWGIRWLWVSSSLDSEDVLYKAAISRGKGNAEDLLGKNFSGVRVSDGYNAYKKNLQGICQLCWAHPLRYLRTLAQTKTLSMRVRKHCLKTYAEFCTIYEQLRNFLKEEYDEGKRKVQKNELLILIRKFTIPNAKDPKKLEKVKAMFKEREAEWLTCMDYENVPADNNKAERMLRHFVIKRKISFGNKSDRGANAFEINASVLMTYWKKFKENFFLELSKL